MRFYKNKRFFSLLLIILIGTCLLASGCGNSETPSPQTNKDMITIAGSTWDSAQVNAEIFSFIAKNGYGYNTDIVMAASAIELQQHAKGDIDVRMENWTKTYAEEYYDPLEKGDFIVVNEILKDNEQGFYVPTVILKGDPQKGIKPLAPDLKSVFDLPKYQELFKDPEDPKKGRIYGAPETWSTNKNLEPKMKNYDLEKYYSLFKPGTDTALATAIASAAEKGEPIIAYYWAPTWLLGKYDLTRLEEPPYDEEAWKTYNCEFPADSVTLTVHKDLPDTAPELVEVLKKFEMDSVKMNEILAYMLDNKADPPSTALWYLKNNQDTWSKWLPQEIAEKVAAALK